MSSRLSRLFFVLFLLLTPGQGLMAKSKPSVDVGVMVYDSDGPVRNAIAIIEGIKEVQYSSIYGEFSFSAKKATTRITISALGHDDFTVVLPTKAPPKKDFVYLYYQIDLDNSSVTAVERFTSSAAFQRGPIEIWDHADTPVIATQVREEDGFKWIYRKHESRRISITDGEKTIIPESLGGKWAYYGNGYFSVGGIDYNCGLYKADGSEVISPLEGYDYIGSHDASVGVLEVLKDKARGLCDLEGNVLIPLDRGYTSIMVWEGEKHSVIQFGKDGKYGLCNLRGVEFVPPEYDFLDLLLQSDLESGYVKLKKGNALGLYSFEGEMLFPLSEEYTSFYTTHADEGLIVVGRGKSKGLFDTDGYEMIPFSEGYTSIIIVPEQNMVVCEKYPNEDYYDMSGLYQRSQEMKTKQTDWSAVFYAASDALLAVSDAMKSVESRSSSSGTTRAASSSSSSSSSSASSANPKEYKSHGLCPAFKVWHSFGNVNQASESVTVTEDKQGIKYLKIGSNYSVLSANSTSTYEGYPVSDFNYTTVVHGVNYFIKVLR